MEEKVITDRECDTRHEGLSAWVGKLETRMEKLESKLWWMITLLVSNLAGIIVLLFKGIR